MRIKLSSADDSHLPNLAGVPAGAPRWVTRELIDLTIRVWQPHYKNLLSMEDALEMILNVGRLFHSLGQSRRT